MRNVPLKNLDPPGFPTTDRHPFRLLLALTVLLLLCGPAHGANFEVGPAGTYTKIQDAIDAALLAGGTNNVRVQQGTYYERISVPSTFATGYLDISGGWNSSFTARTPDPKLTTIDATGGWGGTAVQLRSSGGIILFQYFTVTKGALGGGILVETSGASRMTIQGNRVLGNASVSYGGGIEASISDTSQLHVRSNEIVGNKVQGETGAGGGIYLGAYDTSTFTISTNLIRNNIVETSTGQATGGGIMANVYTSGSGTFTGNTIDGNRLQGAAGSGLAPGSAIWIGTGTAGDVTIRANVWLSNENEKGSGGGFQLSLISSSTGVMSVTDTVVSGAVTTGGVSADARDTSTLRLTNLTIADNYGGAGASITGTGTKSLFNTILYGNGAADNLAGVSTGHNISTDPNFADPLTEDFHLSAPSPAIDAGDNSPPGGLGPYDADFNNRVVNAVVDIGAYEDPVGAVSTFDPNGDGSVTVADVFYLINFLFAGGPAPAGDGDANGDAAVTVADVFYLINYLFAGGPAPS